MSLASEFEPVKAETVRRRLAALHCAAQMRRPRVLGTYQLHLRWRALERHCVGSPDLISLHRQVDRALGGHRQPIGGGR
jgi:hypothetical protein